MPLGPVTNARWAAIVRRSARQMIWSLPAAGVVAAAASIGAMVSGGPAHYLGGDNPFRLVAWVVSVWFGVVAMMSLLGLLVATRSRVSALAGLLIGVLGGLSMLMFAAVPSDTPIWGVDAWVLALVCGGIYAVGWVYVGWAVVNSRMFSRGDGLMIMLSGPMVGIGGLVLSPLHTAGALLMVAGGLGIAWKARATLRAVREGRAAPAVQPVERPAPKTDDVTKGPRLPGKRRLRALARNENKAAEKRAAAEKKAAEQKAAAEKRAAEKTAAGDKRAEQKAADKNAGDKKAAEGKAVDGKAASHRKTGAAASATIDDPKRGGSGNQPPLAGATTKPATDTKPADRKR